MPRFVKSQPTCAWTKPRARRARRRHDRRAVSGVARLVGQRMVLAVVGHPLRDRSLHRHAAEDREQRLDRDAGLEVAVGEVAVEADGRPECADDVEADEEREVVPVEGDTPEQPHRGEQAERRHHDRDQCHDLADPARPGSDGSDRDRCGISFVQAVYTLFYAAPRRRWRHEHMFRSYGETTVARDRVDFTARGQSPQKSSTSSLSSSTCGPKISTSSPSGPPRTTGRRRD